MRASGNGIFDCDALLLCIKKLSEEINQPAKCCNEIVKGCEMTVRRCCDGLADYVRDRGDVARLRVVSQCASAMSGCIREVIEEASYLIGGKSSSLEHKV